MIELKKKRFSRLSPVYENIPICSVMWFHLLSFGVFKSRNLSFKPFLISFILFDIILMHCFLKRIQTKLNKNFPEKGRGVGEGGRGNQTQHVPFLIQFWIIENRGNDSTTVIGWIRIHSSYYNRYLRFNRWYNAFICDDESQISNSFVWKNKRENLLSLSSPLPSPSVIFPRTVKSEIFSEWLRDEHFKTLFGKISYGPSILIQIPGCESLISRIEKREKFLFLEYK